MAVLLPQAQFRFSTLLSGGLKILILNGSGLQIQTSGTVSNIRGVEVGNGMVSNIRWVEVNPYTQWVWIANPDQRYGMEHPRGRGWERHGVEHPPGQVGRDGTSAGSGFGTPSLI